MRCVAGPTMLFFVRGGASEDSAMRIFLPLLALLAFIIVAPGLSVADSKTTKITWGQMVDACGGNNSAGGGHVGCDAPCSSSGSAICDYDCKGTGHCTKTVVAQVVKGLRGAGVEAPAPGDAQSTPLTLPPPDLSTAAVGLSLACTKRADQCLRRCDYPQHSIEQLRCTSACAAAEIECKTGGNRALPALPPPSLSTPGGGGGGMPSQQGGQKGQKGQGNDQGPAGGVP
jgi:hypothetical protein